MTTAPCDFERFCDRTLWFFGRPEKGMRLKKYRCPRCNRRLKLKTVVDHWHPDETFLRVPKHRATAKRLAKQLRLPGVK